MLDLHTGWFICCPAVCWSATKVEPAVITHTVWPLKLRNTLPKKSRETVHQYGHGSERAGLGALKCEVSTSHQARKMGVQVLLLYLPPLPSFQLPPDLCKALLLVFTFQAFAKRSSMLLRCSPYTSSISSLICSTPLSNI